MDIKPIRTPADHAAALLDLLPIFKTRARLSEIMTKKRRLNLTMIRRLHARLAIPFEYLVQDYKLKKAPGAGRSRQR
jgi:antitoxin component HigA of HigAB toxin-antitoxin module